MRGPFEGAHLSFQHFLGAPCLTGVDLSEGSSAY